MLKVVTSKENPKIKLALSLKEKKGQKEHHMFLAETYKSLEMAAKHGQVVEIFATEYVNGYEDINQTLVSEDLLKKLSSNVHPEGVVFMCKEKSLLKKEHHKILYLDDINDPGNMGTLIRTALAFSYDLVVASKNSVSFYNPKVINSSKGAIFAIDVVEDELDKYLEGKTLIVSSLDKDSVDLKEVNIKDDFILVIGSESHGVNPKIVKKADIKVKIEMDNIDSLNAAVAGGILMNQIR